MQAPTPNILSEAEMESVISTATVHLRGTHTHASTRHAVMDIGEDVFDELGAYVRVYAAYRLGFKGKTEADLTSAIGVMERHTNRGLAHLLAGQAEWEVDAAIAQKTNGR